MNKYEFRIPNLPKTHYEFIQRVGKRYNLSQKQVILLALEVLWDLGAKEQPTVEGYVTKVRLAYPTRHQGTPSECCLNEGDKRPA